MSPRDMLDEEPGESFGEEFDDVIGDSLGKTFAKELDDALAEENWLVVC